MREPLLLGTRGSRLALVQSGWVAARLTAATGLDVKLVTITTAGDRSAAPIAQLGETGVFVTALREALLAGDVDFVVHSFKDLPSAPLPGIHLAAVPERADPRDALIPPGGAALRARIAWGSPGPVIRDNAGTVGQAEAGLAAVAAGTRVGTGGDAEAGLAPLAAGTRVGTGEARVAAVAAGTRIGTGGQIEAGLAVLAAGARVGTGSARRAAQLPVGVVAVPIRGNVDTRIRRLCDGDVDVLILAMAGLERLGMADVAIPLDPAVMLPAPAQGALAVECRADDLPTSRALARLDHPVSRAGVAAERAFLADLEAGCSAPVGALARMSCGSLQLTGFVGGKGRAELRGPVTNPDVLGRELADLLLR
jgi:hydroxymethylbilane synthase